MGVGVAHGIHDGVNVLVASATEACVSETEFETQGRKWVQGLWVSGVASAEQGIVPAVLQTGIHALVSE